MTEMPCKRARALILQPLADAHDVAVARQHLLECPLCASDTADDMVESISSRLDILRDPGGTLRLSLLVIASVQVFLALPWIFGETLIWGPRSDTAVAHLTRDGVIGLVLGLAGVAVALTPRLAYFALSICGLLVTLQAVAFIIDRANSTAHPVFETIHVLAVLITALVVIIAFPRRTRR
jgi:hypothetical protein